MSPQRHDTNSTQHSSTTHQSQGSQGSKRSVPEGDLRQLPLADVDDPLNYTRPISRLSLAEFRSKTHRLFWVGNTGDGGPSVESSSFGKCPPDCARGWQPVDGSETKKAVIFAAFLLTADNKDEWVAAKVVKCKSLDESDEKYRKIKNEYDLLEKIRHLHIVAIVGSYHTGSEGAFSAGILLYPLAAKDLHKHMRDLDEHNAERGARRWKRSEAASRLLHFFACLVHALIYLHAENIHPVIKHRDIKPENILIDRNDNIVLADFDVAEGFANKTAARTSQQTWATEQFATDAVKNQEENRGLERDIVNLGMVFLEMATIAFGEQRRTCWAHITGVQAKACVERPPYREYLREVDGQKAPVWTWLQHLKKASADVAPLERFRSQPDLLDDFFNQIWTMCTTTTDDERILKTAYKCFSKLTDKCQHCTASEDFRPARLGSPASHKRISAKMPLIEENNRGTKAKARQNARAIINNAHPLPTDVALAIHAIAQPADIRNNPETLPTNPRKIEVVVNAPETENKTTEVERLKAELDALRSRASEIEKEIDAKTSSADQESTSGPITSDLTGGEEPHGKVVLDDVEMARATSASAVIDFVPSTNATFEQAPVSGRPISVTSLPNRSIGMYNQGPSNAHRSMDRLVPNPRPSSPLKREFTPPDGSVPASALPTRAYSEGTPAYNMFPWPLSTGAESALQRSVPPASLLTQSPPASSSLPITQSPARTSVHASFHVRYVAWERNPDEVVRKIDSIAEWKSIETIPGDHIIVYDGKTFRIEPKSWLRNREDRGVLYERPLDHEIVRVFRHEHREIIDLKKALDLRQNIARKLYDPRTLFVMN